MNGKILAGILCVVFTAAGFVIANSNIFHIPFTGLTPLGVGAFLGVVAAYTVVFSSPGLWLSFLKPTFILALLAVIFVAVGYPHQALMRDWSIIASVVAIMAGVGAFGGLGYNLGLLLGSNESQKKRK